jgi:osmotically-inducible protein OsmY
MSTPTITRTDQEIQQDVLDELAWEAELQPNEVGVVVKNGVVTLTGWVDSYTKRWRAERAALRVRGVEAVANEIEVRLSGSSQRTDSDIAAAARRALEADAFAPDEGIKVAVSNGWVTLEGEVQWQYQRREAERAVRRLTGVRGVTNLIKVSPRIEPSPADLKKRIEDALVRNAETDAERIQVKVNGSTVVLEGTVRSWAERETAERIAWSAPGILEVNNRIKIRP